MKNRIRNDLILVFGILFIALIVFLIFTLGLKSGNRVIITVNGEDCQEYKLNEDIEKRISTKFGENIIQIKDGKVSVISADCSDKICQHHKAISKTGETIVCLPHKLVVEIAEE